MWHKVIHNAVVHVVAVAAAVLVLLGCMDRVVKSFEPVETVQAAVVQK